MFLCVWGDSAAMPPNSLPRPTLSLPPPPNTHATQTDVVFVKAQGGPSPHPPSPALLDGVLRVTTHRLLWVDVRAAPSAGASSSLPLAAVHRVEMRATRLWSSPKVRVHVAMGGGGDGSSARQRLLPASEARSGGATAVELKLVTPAQHAVLEALQASLAARVWERGGSGAAVVATEGSAASAPFDDGVVAAVVALGFTPEAAVAALRAVGGRDAQEAALWLLDHPEAAAAAGTPAAAPGAAEDAAPQLTAASAGVGGLLRRQEAATAADAAAVDAAFVDLRALMAAAAEMVALARRATAATADGGEPTGLEADLASLGIASPVTRQSAGALYARELSRQLADFVAPRLAASGGVLPLTDVYCLFNRARGVELASPADVAAAAKEWSSWPAPVRLREIEGGVLAVQAADLDDAVVRARLATLAAAADAHTPGSIPGLGRPLTPSLVAAELRVPLAIASTLLLDAERAGALCRDDGAEGVRWWHNFFVEAA